MESSHEDDPAASECRETGADDDKTSPSKSIFTCEKCPSKFPSNQALSRHKREQHLKTKLDYPCNVCHRKFKRFEHLKRHSQKTKSCESYVNSNVECKNCKRKFLSADKLASHIRRHCEKKYFCVSCFQFFGKKSLFTSHNCEA